VNSTLATFLFPAAIGVIMLGLGLGLTAADFRRVAAYPRPVAAALVCQVVLLPAACFGLVHLFDLEPVFAVGMMLLAASPGGTVANLYSHLFGGDVALNVTLTAINSVLAVVTMPLVINLSLAYFLSDADADGIGLQFGKTLQVFAVVLIPVLLGMLVRGRRPEVATRLHNPVKVTSAVVLVVVVAAAVGSEADRIGDHFANLGLITFVFSVLSLTTGYAVARAVRATRPQAIAACMEVGLHNSALAIAIAISPSLLDSAEMASPAAVYAIMIFATAAVAGFVLKRPRATGPESALPETTRTAVR
jgi:BASS family bile acid:Na+ symporter